MMQLERINEAFRQFLFENFPDSLKEFKVAIYKKGDPKPEEELTAPDINSPLIQNLVFCYYKALFNVADRYYFTQLWGFVKQFAQRFNDDHKIARLNEIYYNPSDLGFTLPIIEKVVFWSSIAPTSLNKTFNYGYKLKPLRFHELLLAVQEAKKEICEIFQELCSENDVEVPISLEMLSDKGNVLKPL